MLASQKTTLFKDILPQHGDVGVLVLSGLAMGNWESIVLGDIKH